ncbi:MAG: right-handed parallel beta-helix repeat-containing protein, partial [Planctomycetes bacterium]|nr:right-handed parallel beta-helix repeat-containing protein [Planctomycetota bacterium]
MRATFTMAFFIILSLTAFSAVINIPNDFTTIQEAVDYASDGDTILVGPGTYFENIEVLNKQLILQSQAGPERTILDGRQLGSVVTIRNEDSLETVLDGFTITNGIGTVNPGYTWRIGGGVCCALESFSTIQNNIITGNSARLGGGISSAWSIEISDNIIAENSASGDGAGIFTMNAGYTIIVGNEITDNTAAGSGGGIDLFQGSFGLIADNIISNNRSTQDGGGGIFISDGCAATLVNNLITENQVDRRGGGLYLLSNAHAQIFNNTITGNSANNGGAIACRLNSSIEVANSIFWNNEAHGEGGCIYLAAVSGPSLCIISYTDVMNGRDDIFLSENSALDWGPGMIDEDPLFGPNHALTRRSPCINRGIETNAPAADIDGDPRPFMGIVDLGFDEYTGIHGLETTCFELSIDN